MVSSPFDLAHAHIHLFFLQKGRRGRAFFRPQYPITKYTIFMIPFLLITRSACHECHCEYREINDVCRRLNEALFLTKRYFQNLGPVENLDGRLPGGFVVYHIACGHVRPSFDVTHSVICYNSSRYTSIVFGRLS